MTKLVNAVSFQCREVSMPYSKKPRKKPLQVSEPVSLYDAKTHLSELVDRAADGAEIVIAKSGKPKARLVPLAKRDLKKRRIPGKERDEIWIAEDFDAPLPPEELARWYDDIK
ncbi:MAG: type II toxin-antitoxin system Phd/YefM family antitoxin [Gemmatimonadaceae bacterium]